MTWRRLLFPFAWIYGGVAALRRALYRMGIFRSYRSSIPTIVVGNLRVGGTGKTPHTEYILRLLEPIGQRALLSRGYGRKTRGYIWVNQCPEEQWTSDRIGDEPLQVMEKFPGLQVAVSRKRAVALRAWETLPNPPRVVVLDDAYQHVRIQGGLKILLTEYGDLYADDHPLPAGNLREFATAARHADLVVVTKAPPALSQEEGARLRIKLRLSPQQHLLCSYNIYNNIFPKNKMAEKADLSPCSPALLLSGIAKPRPLEQYVSSKFNRIKHLKFTDHHIYSKHDLQKIREYYNELGEGAVVITTEKDHARLKMEVVSGALADLPVFVLPMAVEFLFDGKKELTKIIGNYVRKSGKDCELLEK